MNLPAEALKRLQLPRKRRSLLLSPAGSASARNEKHRLPMMNSAALVVLSAAMIRDGNIGASVCERRVRFAMRHRPRRATMASRSSTRGNQIWTVELARRSRSGGCDFAIAACIAAVVTAASQLGIQTREDLPIGIVSDPATGRRSAVTESVPLAVALLVPPSLDGRNGSAPRQIRRKQNRPQRVVERRLLSCARLCARPASAATRVSLCCLHQFAICGG